MATAKKSPAKAKPKAKAPVKAVKKAVPAKAKAKPVAKAPVKAAAAKPVAAKAAIMAPKAGQGKKAPNFVNQFIAYAEKNPAVTLVGVIAVILGVLLICG